MQATDNTNGTSAETSAFNPFVCARSVWSSKWKIYHFPFVCLRTTIYHRNCNPLYVFWLFLLFFCSPSFVCINIIFHDFSVSKHISCVFILRIRLIDGNECAFFCSASSTFTILLICFAFSSMFHVPCGFLLCLFSAAVSSYSNR